MLSLVFIMLYIKMFLLYEFVMYNVNWYKFDIECLFFVKGKSIYVIENLLIFCF